MTKFQLWLIYVNRNPSFEGAENIAMSPKGLKKLFDQTWALAQQEILEREKVDNPFDKSGLFGDIFGHK